MCVCAAQPSYDDLVVHCRIGSAQSALTCQWAELQPAVQVWAPSATLPLLQQQLLASLLLYRRLLSASASSSPR